MDAALPLATPRLDAEWMPPSGHLVTSTVHSRPLRNRNAHRGSTRWAACSFLRRNVFPALSTQIGWRYFKDFRDRPIQPLSHLSGAVFTRLTTAPST